MSVLLGQRSYLVICVKERSREMFAALRQEAALKWLSERKGYRFGSLLKI